MTHAAPINEPNHRFPLETRAAEIAGAIGASLNRSL